MGPRELEQVFRAESETAALFVWRPLHPGRRPCPPPRVTARAKRPRRRHRPSGCPCSRARRKARSQAWPSRRRSVFREAGRAELAPPSNVGVVPYRPSRPPRGSRDADGGARRYGVQDMLGRQLHQLRPFFYEGVEAESLDFDAFCSVFGAVLGVGGDGASRKGSGHVHEDRRELGQRRRLGRVHQLFAAGERGQAHSGRRKAPLGSAATRATPARSAAPRRHLARDQDIVAARCDRRGGRVPRRYDPALPAPWSPALPPRGRPKSRRRRARQ